MLDVNGVIQDATLSNIVSAEQIHSWRGRAWTETVEDSGPGKVRHMLAEALEHGVSAFRQLNQRFPSGLEVPIEYTTVRLGGNAGLIAIGRSMQAVADLQSRLIAAQQAMEQEYWKLREVETRYRVLFDASHEAVLTLRADDLRIIEANPVAIRGLGVTRGRDLLPELANQDREPFRMMLERVRQAGRAPGMLLHFGPQNSGWMVRASLMPGEPGALFLLQLVRAEPEQFEAPGPVQTALDEFFDRLPDAVVVIDRDGHIRRANRAFMDLVQVGGEGAVMGVSLSRWLSRPGADLGVLMSMLHRYGSVRLFSTAVRGELGTDTDVEISAAGNARSRPGHCVLLLRDVGRRLPVRDSSAHAGAREGTTSLQAALGAIIEQSARTPLRSLVRDTVGLVERHYILAALELTHGNRTAAAEMLGLSRQGFYKKLAQYEIDGHARPEDDCDD